MTTPRKPKKTYDSEMVPDNEVAKRLPRARTPEARESQLVALAYDLAEKQLIAGTASSQVMSHLLKIGSTREKAELYKLKQDTLLTEAKVKDLANVEEMKVLYTNAMDAMRGYKGEETSDGDPNIF